VRPPYPEIKSLIGRILDVVLAANTGGNECLVAGQSPIPGVLKDWIEKFIIMEDIRITDLTRAYNTVIVYVVSGE
jgi:hypothetical protein